MESTLVYFATSLRANSTVLDRLTRYKRLEQYPDDMELLDDVIVEIRQAIEMTSIYRDDIKGTRELFSSILDNRLNNAMKYLTSVTLLMAVPTVISGLYGMNVDIDGISHCGTPRFPLTIYIIGESPPNVTGRKVKNAPRRAGCGKQYKSEHMFFVQYPGSDPTNSKRKQADND